MASTNFTPLRVPNTQPIPGSPNSPGHSDYMNGKVFIAAGIILVVIVFFVVAFHVYARVFLRRRGSSMSWRRSLGSHDMPLAAGLDKETVDSLPKFAYTTPLILHEGGNVVSKDAGAGVVECAVCLVGFEENDACRLLPKCSHIFHTECIDRWFLSNTTCPLCRASAEQVDSDEAPSVSCSAHQAFGDGIQRSNSSHSDCLLPHQEIGSHVQRQEINNHTQRPRSGSPFGAEIEGAGLHVRRMLARTCSSRVNASYDLVGEDMHSDAMSESVHGERNGSMGRGCANGNHAGDALVRNLHLPYWQRSISDRSLNERQGLQFPSNILFWGNHSRVNSRLHGEQHWGVGGRSFPHIAIDVAGPQESTLTTAALSATAVQEESHGFSLIQCSTRPVG